MRYALLALVCLLPLQAQQVQRWFATTGDVSLSGAGMTATIQQPATNGSQIAIEQIVVYCSVACTVTQAANGAAATATAGTITPLLPTQLNSPAPFTFWTASNVGSGTAQGGNFHLLAGNTVALCLSTSCGSGSPDVIMGTGGGTGVNYSATVSSITGTANITFYARKTQ